MICDENPFRRRLRKSMAKWTRREGCVYITTKLAEWASERGQLAKFKSSEGCGGNAVPWAVECRYDCHGFEGYLGNVE